MSEYRNRTTGEVKTQGQWRKLNPNMSLPRVWKQATLDALNLDPVLSGSRPTEVGAYQKVVRDGVVQDSNNNWVHNWIVVDMFADDKASTKAAKETAYQAGLDAKIAEGHRVTRNKLLADSDWTQMNDSPLSNEAKTAWATYREELRNITGLAAWPNLENADWPVAP